MRKIGIFALVAACTVFALGAIHGVADALSVARDAVDVGGAALAMAVQTSYSANMSEAVAGMPGSMVEWSAETRNVETAAGIGFGLALSRGSGTKGCVLGGTAFIGVSQKDVTVLNSTSPDKYPQYASLASQYLGDIWVQTSVAVAESDPVHYDATTGIFKVSGGQGPIENAKWVKPATSAGLALLRLNKP